MKFNITDVDLERQLVLSNSFFAHYKGSVKAVRILLNMLGFKNIVINGSNLCVRIFFTDDITADILEGNGVTYANNKYTYTNDSNTTSFNATIVSDASYPYISLESENTIKTSTAAQLNLMLKGIAQILTNAKSTEIYKSMSYFGTLPSNDIYVFITNVNDADLTTAKTALVKQLIEILPINMILDTKHIIGYSNE